MTLRFGSGMDGFYTPVRTPEWLAGSPSERKTVPDVGYRLRGHWVIPSAMDATSKCYLCSRKFSDEAIADGRVPPCEAGEE